MKFSLEKRCVFPMNLLLIMAKNIRPLLDLVIKMMVADEDIFFGQSDAINDVLKYSNMKTLNKYASMDNSIPFEAWLFDGIQDYRQKMPQVYDFTLYTNEVITTTSKPLVTIGLNSKYKQTHYSEIQMVDIWVRIVESLRYKPNDV